LRFGTFSWYFYEIILESSSPLKVISLCSSNRPCLVVIPSFTISDGILAGPVKELLWPCVVVNEKCTPYWSPSFGTCFSKFQEAEKICKFHKKYKIVLPCTLPCCWSRCYTIWRCGRSCSKHKLINLVIQHISQFNRCSYLNLIVDYSSEDYMEQFSMHFLFHNCLGWCHDSLYNTFDCFQK